jgi:hypothetical protein
VREARPERVHGHAWTGAIAGAFLSWLLAYPVSLLFGGPIRENFLDRGGPTPGRLAFLALLLATSGLMFLGARRAFVRHEVLGSGDAAAARRGSGVWIAVAVGIFVALALLAYLLLAVRA